MTLLLAATLLFASVYLVGEYVTLPARERRASLQRALRVERARPGSVDLQPGFRERVLAPLRGRLARMALRLSPSSTTEAVAGRLAAAGMRGVAPTSFLAAKGAAAVAGLLIGLLFGASGGAAVGIVFGLVLAGAGLFAPDLILNSRARRRREAVEAQLPDALDLLAVSVEAGLGFDAAMAKLTEYLDGPLIEELGLALSEMRIGRGRHEALRKLGERIDSAALSGFVRAVIQADQLGGSIGRILKVQADDARDRRQAAAEEKAMKAPIKMLFPTVLFIFPAMFVVILGPAILNFGKVFS